VQLGERAGHGRASALSASTRLVGNGRLTATTDGLLQQRAVYLPDVALEQDAPVRVRVKAVAKAVASAFAAALDPAAIEVQLPSPRRTDSAAECRNEEGCCHAAHADCPTNRERRFEPF